MSIFYFDSSAIVKLYLDETGSGWVDQIYYAGELTRNPDHRIVISNIGIVEVAAAIARRHRMGVITAQTQQELFGMFIQDSSTRFRILGITDSMIQLAISLTQRFPLRGYDVVNLAAALILSQEQTGTGLPPIIFVSADNVLCQSAISEGLITENPNNYP
jgi:predicted nucleic acid-binding protein